GTRYDPISGCVAGCVTGEVRNLVSGQCEPAPGGSDTEPPPPPPGPSCAVLPPRLEQYGALHVWRLQRNRGLMAPGPDATFEAFAPDDPTREIHAPQPLRTVGAEGLIDRVSSPELPSLTDINGDGWLDIVAIDPPSLIGYN